MNVLRYTVKPSMLLASVLAVAPLAADGDADVAARFAARWGFPDPIEGLWNAKVWLMPCGTQPTGEPFDRHGAVRSRRHVSRREQQQPREPRAASDAALGGVRPVGARGGQNLRVCLSVLPLRPRGQLPRVDDRAPHGAARARRFDAIRRRVRPSSSPPRGSRSSPAGPQALLRVYGHSLQITSARRAATAPLGADSALRRPRLPRGGPSAPRAVCCPKPACYHCSPSLPGVTRATAT